MRPMRPRTRFPSVGRELARFLWIVVRNTVLAVLLVALAFILTV